MKSIQYVITENMKNLYRIFCIVKYEIVAENRDSKLGMLWSILDPVIQILSYWFAFGIGIRGGQPIEGVEHINWMLVGITPWFFLSACIRNGTSSIHKKANIIKKMKFPISILPTTVIIKELFYHVIMIICTLIFLVINGVTFNINFFEIFYYLICALAFSLSLSMVTSVLNMFTRDIKKAVNASMRLLMFITPILWSMEKLPSWGKVLMEFNPMYYIIDGYRNSMLFNKEILLCPRQTIIFWAIVILLFIVGSNLIYNFKHKFIDFI